MIVCYDNTVNGQKLADVDCSLLSACIPRADSMARPPHTFVKDDQKHTFTGQVAAEKTGFEAAI